jgi:hypothetical protein
MKSKLFFLLALFSLFFSGYSYADEGDIDISEIDIDKIMWESAYEGNFSLVHKMALARPIDNINDVLINAFVIAYVHYKAGHKEHVDSIFKGIDNYLEQTILIKHESNHVLE